MREISKGILTIIRIGLVNGIRLNVTDKALFGFPKTADINPILNIKGIESGTVN